MASAALTVVDEFRGKKLGLLWIDDQIDKLAPWIKRFQQLGICVQHFESVDSAYEQADLESVDVIFLDELMPGGKGSNSITRFRSKVPAASIYIVSTYFYLDNVTADLLPKEQSPLFRFGRIDKTSLPLTDDPEAIAQFLREIFLEAPENIETAVTETTQKLIRLPAAADISWDDYSKLDMAGKLDLHIRVDEWTRAVREEWFSKGSTYLVFCGSWTKPFYARKGHEFPCSEEELYRLVRETGQAAFVYSSGGPVDDLTQHCSVRSDIRGYPALRIERGGRQEAMHFDTGNPYTLISYERFTLNGWIEPIHIIETRFAGEMVLRGKHHKLDNVIFRDSDATTQTGCLTAFSVINWNQYRIALRCGRDCDTAGRGGDPHGLCIFRHGLLGRTIGQDLGCEFQINFRTGAVQFREAEA